MAEYTSRYQRDELLAVIRAQGRLEDDVVQEVDLRGVRCDGFVVQRCTLRNGIRAAAALRASRWEEVALQGVSLRKADLAESTIEACGLYGSDLMNGCAGFGDTADLAMRDFDKNWIHQKAPTPALDAGKGGRDGGQTRTGA